MRDRVSVPDGVTVKMIVCPVVARVSRINSQVLRTCICPQEPRIIIRTGRPLAAMLAYTPEDIDGLPESAIESFAGTGNPLSQRRLNAGEAVVDVRSGAGFDSLQAARQVGHSGSVIGVDMTQAMMDKATEGVEEMGLTNAEFRLGYAESLPVDDGFADVMISNGVINLTPMKEIFRVLKPGGRIHIGDIVLHVEVPQSAKDEIDLWSG